MFAYALTGTIYNGETIFANVVTGILSPLYQLMAVIAFVYFMYGIAKFMIDLNQPEKRSFGKSHLLWGLVGLFIIFSVGGLLPMINKLIGGMFTY